MNDLVSIVIPNYNNEMFLTDCIISCAASTYKNIEIIVVDDCSTDSSERVISRAIMQFPEIKIRAIRCKENKGIGHARNEGIIASKGKYVVHVDADDMLVADGIEKRYNAIIKDDSIGYVHANAYGVSGDIGLAVANERALSGELKIHKVEGSRPHAQTIMVKRTMYEMYGLYCESLIGRVDREMLSRWAVFASRRGVKINDVVAYYRRHENSVTSRRNESKEIDLKVISDYEKRMADIIANSINGNNTRFI